MLAAACGGLAAYLCDALLHCEAADVCDAISHCEAAASSSKQQQAVACASNPHRAATTTTQLTLSNKELDAIGAKPYILSLEDCTVDDIEHLVTSISPRAVIFSAGAGGKGAPERTRAVDLEGLKKVAQALQKTPCKRLLIVSAIDVRDRTQGYPAHYNEDSKKGSDEVWSRIGRYMQAKYEADAYLHQSGLDFTILRPGRLTHEPAGGCDLGLTQMGHTSRALVGEVLLACALTDGTIGLTLDVLDGTKSVKEEVDRCARLKVDAWGKTGDN